jgi:hypothetical protein
MTSEETILDFAASAIASIWALELLLTLKKESNGLTSAELVRKLRGSEAAVSEALMQLTTSGLIAEDRGAYRYRPAQPETQDFVVALETLYREKPMTVISAIAHAPNRKS